MHLNQQGKIGRLNATSEQICEIKRQNQLEYMIYDVAHRLLDAQLLVIDARTSSKERKHSKQARRFKLSRAVNGTRQTGPSEFCSTSP